ncbi:GNAT family N-acetyltransferase [Oceaniglobus indicus]|uniref:GNAT family N-acetyltransferase n=1 Tax=Oceaniglobus indicus TaxID=2047749 RepID=UPI000C17AC98|nr:GNAT family N-acetyltransferase [Oceaniglobus indicus]
MELTWTDADFGDVAAIVDLLTDDGLGTAREGDDLAHYEAAFRLMADEAANHLIVGRRADRIVATYHITFIRGLSRTATRRAQIEGVRVASALRGQGIGGALMRDAEGRARAAGCGLLQFTSDARRDRAHAFYADLGFVPSHVGFKKLLTADTP